MSQYVYFALSSKTTTAQEITAFLGMKPDEVTVRGSRLTEPVVRPVLHRWKIVCRDSGLRVDEQVARVLDRLRPHTQRIAELAGGLATQDPSHTAAVLQIVRYFHVADEDGESDPPTPPDPQPYLFGWHLDRTVLDFLAVTGAELDVDEYYMTPDPAWVRQAAS